MKVQKNKIEPHIMAALITGAFSTIITLLNIYFQAYR